MTFKVGDKVRCITTSGAYFIKNKIYEVCKVKEYDFYLTDEFGDETCILISTFELVKPGKKVKEKPKDYHGIFKASCMNYVTLCDSEKLAKD